MELTKETVADMKVTVAMGIMLAETTKDLEGDLAAANNTHACAAVIQLGTLLMEILNVAEDQL